MKTYSFKLYKSRKNKALHRSIDVAGYIYNHCIALHKRYYCLYGRSLNMNRLQKHVTKLKKRPRFGYWNELGSQAIQDIAQCIDKAYKLFFRNRKAGIRTAPPSFQKVRKYKSYTLKQAGYKLLDDNHLFIMGKTYKFFKSREVEGEIKTLTVKRDALGDIYLYFVCKVEENLVLPRTGNSVGLDFGLKTFLKASDGNEVVAPQFLKQGTRKIRALTRSLSRKRNDSNNRKRAKLTLARAHRRIANQRRDYHFKLARRMAGDYAIICVEDLNIKSMQTIWGRKISDLGHASFLVILGWQCSKVGSELRFIDRFYPSSKTCSTCGFVIHELHLRARHWTCPYCCATHDRDVNAAANIHRVGTSTLGREGVRPA